VYQNLSTSSKEMPFTGCSAANDADVMTPVKWMNDKHCHSQLGHVGYDSHHPSTIFM
jgi:hypothetical protein